MTARYLLSTQGLTKEFKGFVAVKDVSLQVREGTIHALIGPNGAGKTTFFNLLTKFLVPTSGSIFYNGDNITGLRPAEISRRGVVRSFQISAVFPHLTALENVRVALQRKSGDSFDFWRSDRVLDRLDGEARALLDAVGLADRAEIMAAQLPYGQKRALELATTLALDPRLMLLDEPTAGMASADIERMVALIRRVSERRTIVMVEHNLGVVSALANVVTVLSAGSVLAEGDYESIAKNPQVIAAYIGAKRD
ncbi:MAG: ABC transporter ATP-binding protein [Pseudorhodoplanes sp.]|uniref:ABC transporter ATP-binding protein n=1 Tax=Pseudorhodoplanes sp. TaxID=1934341 RepID=UPI003D10FE3C